MAGSLDDAFAVGLVARSPRNRVFAAAGGIRWIVSRGDRKGGPAICAAIENIIHELDPASGG